MYLEDRISEYNIMRWFGVALIFLLPTLFFYFKILIKYWFIVLFLITFIGVITYFLIDNYDKNKKLLNDLELY